MRGRPFKKGCIPWNKSEKVLRQCMCGSVFSVVPSRSETAKYCSYPCKQKWQVTLNNPAKKPENRKKISDALRGRDAYWMRGMLNPSKRMEVRNELRRKVLKRWNDSTWVSRMIIDLSSGFRRVESWDHVMLKRRAAAVLHRYGYVCRFEVPVECCGHWYVADVLANSESKNVIVECGFCKPSKLEELRSEYFVTHLPFGSDVEEELCAVL